METDEKKNKNNLNQMKCKIVRKRECICGCIHRKIVKEDFFKNSDNCPRREICQESKKNE